MPIHRAFYRTSAEAQAAASAAVTRLTALWQAKTSAAGAEIESTASVVGVRIVAVDAMPASDPVSGYADAQIKITAPDGRQGVARVRMPSSQTDTLVSAASGIVEVLLIGFALAKVVARRAAMVNVTATGAANLTTAHKLTDPMTGKLYQVNSGGFAVAAGTTAVPVQEVDSTDENDVTYGTVLEFVAPPSNVDTLTRVCSMEPIAVADASSFLDADGRLYTAANAANKTETHRALAGDLFTTVDVYRNTSDGIADITSLEVDAELTYQGTVGTFSPTLVITTKHEVELPAGTTLTFGGKSYETIAAVTIPDTGYASVSVRAKAFGPASDFNVGNTLTITSPPTGVLAATTVTTAVHAGTYPEPYTSQVIGGSLTWSSSVFKASDGRWVAEVYTLPRGS